MRAPCLLVAALAALIVPVVADAKGASEATVTGPGLDKPLYFGGGESEGTPVMKLVLDAGFFPAAFCCQTPDPMSKSRPKGPLGPRYTIHWVVPGNEGRGIEQDVYPYAKPSPVTYMPAGQPIFDRSTSGGWFVASSALKQLLVDKGLPRRLPRAVAIRHSRANAWLIGGAAVAVAAAGFGLWRRT